MRFRWLISTVLISLFIAGGYFFIASAANQGVEVNFTVPTQGGSSSNPPPTNSPPAISNVVSSVGYTTGTVSWAATDAGGITNSAFVYGLTTGYGSSGFVTGNYQVNLTSLATGTLYYFQISATDNTSLVSYYTGSFTTQSFAPPPDTTPPIISNILASPGATTSTITWNTNEAADSQVNYGTTVSYGGNSLDSAKTLVHSLLLFSLIPNTTYHYRVVSADSAGNSAASTDLTFKTLKDNNPPPDVSNLEVTAGANSISASWINPPVATVPDFSGVKVVRKVNSQSVDTDDGTTVYTGSGEAFIDNNVLKNVNYFYTVFSFDTSLNFSPGAFDSDKILPPSSQEICTNGVDDDVNGQVDCSDAACSADPVCAAPPAEICNNGIDDNNNGAIDCSDGACANDASCRAVRAEICNNGVDDDGNGAVDCSDGACSASPFCAASVPTVGEVCDNTIDDDSNGKIDCSDSACFVFSGCALSTTPTYVPPTSTVPSFVKISADNVAFFTGNRKIQLAIRNEEVTGIAGFPLIITVGKANLPAVPLTLTAKIDGQDQHQLVYEAATDSYYGSMVFPNIGSHQLSIEIDYGAGQFDSIQFKLASQAFGTISDSGGPVDQAEITLFNENDNIFSAENFGERNPFLTNANGTYGWMVPNGRYYLKVVKEGYYTRSLPAFTVDDNIINISVNLVRVPPSLLDVIDPNASLQKNITNVAKNLAQKSKVVAAITAQTVVDTAKVLQEVAKDPEVQKVTSQVVAPTAVSVASVSSIALISWIDFLPFLRLLFLQPLMLLGLRKREKWGQV